MSTSKIFDGRFSKRLVIICGLVPAALLVWDAYRGQLGVNEVNFAIRSTGLIGLVMLSLSLLVTPLRRITGWNLLISVRRNLGVLGFFYILAHFLIFFALDRDWSISSTVEEIVMSVYLWFGFGALVLMIPLAVTSTDSMVSRLGSKRWKLLHRLAYVAIFGGLVHYWLLVKADTTKPFFFTVAFSALMLARIAFHYWDLRKEVAAARAKTDAMRTAKPAKKKFWSGELRVARIFDETHDVKTFRFVMPDGSALPFEHIAGQYINLALMIDGKRVNRSYTIASSPTRSAYCEISVKRAPDGYASKHLHDKVREGDLIKVSAPAGKFHFAGHEAKRIVLIAGGVGITPMMSVIRSLTDRAWQGEIVLLFSVKQPNDVIFEHELGYLQKRFPNLKVEVINSKERGHITRAAIEAAVPGIKNGPVMLCGPMPMMVAMRKILVEEIGIPNAEVHEEEFVSPKAVAESATNGATNGVAEVAINGDANVTFKKSGKASELGSLTVLEAAEECGVTIPYECRSGICGQCKTHLVAGRVTMEVQDALSASDRAKGLILACQARAGSDVTVDA